MTVRIGEEDILTSISALGDVMRYFGDYCSGHSGHV
jgi:hypothetical protein